MRARVSRVELDEYNRVSAIEFHVESSPDDVLAFLREYKIGKNFMTADAVEHDLKYQTDAAHLEGLRQSDLTAET